MEQNFQPWIRKSYESFGIIRLHEEIIDFSNYIKPTKLEIEIRNTTVAKLKTAIVSKWPSAVVEVFGSFANGLFAPTSDIDVVIFGDWLSEPLKTVEKLLIKTDFAKDIRVVNATVPIVKYVDRESEIAVDISFNKDSGLKNLPFVKRALVNYPNLRSLFLCVKQFLFLRDLSEAYTGGMGSYCLMMLCISYFQHHNISYKQSMNLGVLLMEFFELYGRNLNYLNTGIIVSGKGQYIKRLDNLTAEKPTLLYVEDPIDSSINVGRSCYGIHLIRSAFGHAFTHLHKRVVPSLMYENIGKKGVKNESILGSILWIDKNALYRRELYRNRFSHLVDHHELSMSISTPSETIKVNTSNKKRRLPNRKSKPMLKNFTVMESRNKKSKKNEFYKVRQPKSYDDLLSWTKSNIFNHL